MDKQARSLAPLVGPQRTHENKQTKLLLIIRRL